MGLTSTTLVTVLAVLTVASFVAVIIGWQRLAGTGLLLVSGRALSLLLVNLLVLLTAATALNTQFLFFASWQDLSGAFGTVPHQSALRRGGAAGSAVADTVPGQAAVAAAALPPLPAGASVSQPIAYTITGPRSGVTAQVLVQLPPGYTAAANANVRYPVLEAFAGYPGSPRSWFGGMDITGVMAQQVQVRQLRPTLVVSPQMGCPPGSTPSASTANQETRSWRPG